MAFFTIHPAAALSAGDLDRAIEAGPPQVAVGAHHEDMLRDAGFEQIESVDVTEEYRNAQAAWQAGWLAHEERLVALVGQDDFDARQLKRRRALAAIDDGILRRTRYFARRP